MKFTAVGDVLIQKRLPGEYEGFKEITNYIKQGDFSFFNLETTINNGDCFASQFSGGSWLRAEPEVLCDLKKFGFNVLSFANNHTMDFSYDGLLQTLENVNNMGFINAGAGENLSEAASPKYLDTLKGRIALISVVSSFAPPAMAGEQSRRFKGRPGVNGLRYRETYTVTREYMDILKTIAEETCMNSRRDISRKEGYLPKLSEDEFEFLNILFKEGDSLKRTTTVNLSDMERIKKAIYEAKLQADYIVISFHSHEVGGKTKETPDDFIIEFAHNCIDEGAHAVIGSGPHILRPIEIYKERPIFYSLGNFVMQNENIQYAPEDFYQKYGLTSDSTMHELFKIRSNNFKRGLMTDIKCFETVIPYWEMKDGKLTKLELMPVELGFDLSHSISGWPKPAKDLSFIERLKEMSKPFGTKIFIDNGVVKIGVN